jgi:hypothetical protein
MPTVNRALLVLALCALGLAGCRKEPDCHLPTIDCGGKCVDASTDASNCGGCGVTCGAGQTCCGRCVDLATDAANCGGCGQDCGLGTCGGGVCTCTPAGTHCPAAPNPWCRDLTTDRANCGTCGTACTFPGSTCEGGACGCFAPDPVECTSAVSAHPKCTDLFDPQNCGTCGVACTAPGKTVCPAGACACTSPGLTDCKSSGIDGCFDLQTDEAHCGGCVGHACVAGDLCCGGSCKPVATDNANCGACGNSCAAPKSCQGGSCTCPALQPVACGSACCVQGCCGSGASATCKTAHGNGLGPTQIFFDCTATYPPGTTTRDAAVLAAKAFGDPAPTDTALCGSSPCIQGQKSGACAIWCYGPNTPGSLAGLVGTSVGFCSVAACPNTLTGIAWPTVVP